MPSEYVLEYIPENSRIECRRQDMKGDQMFIQNQKKQENDCLLDPKIDEEMLLTCKQFCQKYPWPSISGLRAYIYRSIELGLSEAFIRAKRRVLIKPITFFRLIQRLELHPNQKGGNFEETQSKKRKAH